MATHSSVLAWRIPWTEGAWRATVHGVTNSETWLSTHPHLQMGRHWKEGLLNGDSDYFLLKRRLWMNSSSFCFHDFRTDIKCIYYILMDQIGRSHLCIPVADSFWYMAKPIQYCKGKKKKKKNLSFLEFWNLAFIWKAVEWESHKMCRVW